MNISRLCAAILTAGTLTACFLDIASAADVLARPVPPPARRLPRAAVNYEPPIVLPIAPSDIFYDYPYLYSNGHFPTHIGPGLIVYGIPYKYNTERFYPRYVNYSDRCAFIDRRAQCRWISYSGR
jgi:hypothetical protein